MRDIDSRLTVAVITDSHRRKNTGSSTREIMRSGCFRGHGIWLVDPADVTSSTDRATYSRATRVVGEAGSWGTILTSDHVKWDLSDFDVVLMRLQPPIDPGYVALCSQLFPLEDSSLWVNSPRSILLSPEKLWPLRFPELHPPTIVSSSREEHSGFRKEHGRVVVKPLFNYQGNGVTFISEDESEFDLILDAIGRKYGEPLVIQRFVPEVAAGDKRVFIIDGRPVGCFLRVPSRGSTVANLHAGGTAKPAELDTRDLEICETIAPELIRANLPFVALDIVGGYLTEIGTTSPTGLIPIRDFSGVSIASALWKWIEERVI